MANDWGRPFTPEELEKLAAKPAGNELHYTGPNLAFQVPPTDPAPVSDWGKPVNSVGSYYAPDGTLMNADGTRSVFDDVDAGPDGDPMQGRKAWSLPDINGDEWPTKPTLHDNPICYAWHPESGCGIIFSDRDALNEALEAEPLLVEMTKEEYDEANKVHAADWPEPLPHSELNPDAGVTGRGMFNPAKDSPATAAQMAALFATKGTPEQQREALAWAQGADVKTAPVETYSEADGPWYVVYFGPVLYTVLAGPYDTQDDAAARLDIVWGQFEHDAAYDFTFPVRERSGLRAATVRTVYNLKGAYGKQ